MQASETSTNMLSVDLSQNMLSDNNLDLTHEEIIEHCCRLPEDAQRIWTVSNLDLLRRSGFLEHPECLTQESVLRFLRLHPSVADAWEWEIDTRGTPSSHLAYLNGALFGSIAVWSRDRPRKIYKDPLEALSDFIVRRIEDIASLARMVPIVLTDDHGREYMIDRSREYALGPKDEAIRPNIIVRHGQHKTGYWMDIPFQRRYNRGFSAKELSEIELNLQHNRELIVQTWERTPHTQLKKKYE